MTLLPLKRKAVLDEKKHNFRETVKKHNFRVRKKKAKNDSNSQVPAVP